MDIDTFWEYGDPAQSELRFRSALDLAQGDERLELLTQIARTFSLRERFADAHSLLDEVVPQLPAAPTRAHVRYQLERGRTFRSGGEAAGAHTCFVAAWELAQAIGQVGLAVDAAHMLALCAADTPAAIEWNMRGLALARTSFDPKAQALIPAMLNNTAWDLHTAGRFDEALGMFEDALVAWQQRDRPDAIRIAKWSVGRCLRSLERYADALAAQLALEAECAAAGSPDGYVFEEIAENMSALGRHAAAQPYFVQAFDALSKDAWLVAHEAARLEHLRERAGI